MRSFLNVFLHKDGLSLSQNNIYRNFNILLAIALLDLSFILISLMRLEQRWPLQIGLAEFACYILLLVLHVRGYFMIARYGTFILTLVMQSTGCIIHGEAAGFDYLFYALAVLPTLFFEKKFHYVSLFAISIATMLGIQYVYELYPPLIIWPGKFIFYWNIFFTGVVVLLVMYFFKSGYERIQHELLEQHKMIAQQKEEIEGINNNLEQIIVDRTERIKDQEIRINQFAFINAHKVRSPLARIMGLLNLIDMEKNKASTVEECLPKLKSNAEELNEMLKEVSSTLNGIEKNLHE